jgi:hypothetical protein
MNYSRNVLRHLRTKGSDDFYFGLLAGLRKHAYYKFGNLSTWLFATKLGQVFIYELLMVISRVSRWYKVHRLALNRCWVGKHWGTKWYTQAPPVAGFAALWASPSPVIVNEDEDMGT